MIRRLLAVSAALLLLAFSPCALSAKFTEWKDAQGKPFRGEPAEIVGPFALFRTPGDGGRRVLLRQLSDEDCLRFAAALPAQDAATATAGSLATELNQTVFTVRNGALAPVEAAARPLPDVLVVFYGASNTGESWAAYFNFLPTYQRLRAAYGDRFDALLFGVRTDALQHRDFAINNRMPWLVADYAGQRAMPTLAQQAPAEGIRLLALSRRGVPLLSTAARDLGEVRQFVDELTDLLFLLAPDNPLCWPDRLRYFNLVRPARHPAGAMPPLLIGSPLRHDVLRRKGIAAVAAHLEVGPDGRVTAAEIAPDCGVPEALRATFADGLRRGCMFSPALAAGQPVAAPYDLRLDVPPAPACSAADLAWLNGEARVETPLMHWLVLRPIRVPEQSFSSVDRVDENGVNVLTPFEVSDEKIAPTLQHNAFDSDWFAADGADSVHPVPGAPQVVDGRELTWQHVLAQDGLVDMRTAASCDFSIGYAWTEIEVDHATAAWLALGSDDGVKIWLNGQLVHNRWIRRNSRLDDDIVPLQLHAGRNQLLIKIQNMTKEWSFVARLRRRS